MNPTEPVEIIRSWRDRTAHIFGVPYARGDDALVRSVKGWWRDVDTLLRALDVGTLSRPDEAPETVHSGSYDAGGESK